MKKTWKILYLAVLLCLPLTVYFVGGTIIHPIIENFKKGETNPFHDSNILLQLIMLGVVLSHFLTLCLVTDVMMKHNQETVDSQLNTKYSTE